MDNSKLAEAIRKELNKMGAGLGDVSSAIIEGVLNRELPQIAAQILGERGGHATSDAKTAANRDPRKCNAPPKAGKKRRGRPEGSKNKPKQESVK